jgi:hypothetical protein
MKRHVRADDTVPHDERAAIAGVLDAIRPVVAGCDTAERDAASRSNDGESMKKEVTLRRRPMVHSGLSIDAVCVPTQPFLPTQPFRSPGLGNTSSQVTKGDSPLTQTRCSKPTSCSSVSVVIGAGLAGAVSHPSLLAGRRTAPRSTGIRSILCRTLPPRRRRKSMQLELELELPL